MWRAFLVLLQRDLLLAWRRPGEALTPLGFFVMVTTLFPLGLSPLPETLRAVAPGVVWTAALLAALLGLDNLFRTDQEDGSLEQIVLSPEPLALLASAKIVAHWLTTGLPLALVAPLTAYMMEYPPAANGALVAGLLLGTPLLSLLGAVGAALTVGVRSTGLLLPIIVLPLAVPVLIFGARSADLAARGDDPAGPLYLLAALLAFGASLVPLAVAGALRISQE